VTPRKKSWQFGPSAQLEGWRGLFGAGSAPSHFIGIEFPLSEPHHYVDHYCIPEAEIILKILIFVNVDGFSIAKRSNSQFRPILVLISNIGFRQVFCLKIMFVGHPLM
jgi:hypothetical protein